MVINSFFARMNLTLGGVAFIGVLVFAFGLFVAHQNDIQYEEYTLRLTDELSAVSFEEIKKEFIIEKREKDGLYKATRKNVIK